MTRLTNGLSNTCICVFALTVLDISSTAAQYVRTDGGRPYASDTLIVGYEPSVSLADAVDIRAQFGSTLKYRYHLINAEVWTTQPGADILALTGSVATLAAVAYAEPSWLVGSPDGLDEYEPGTIFVKYVDGVTAAEKARLRARYNGTLAYDFPTLNAEEWRIDRDLDVKQRCTRFAADNAIAYAEPKYYNDTYNKDLPYAPDVLIVGYHPGVNLDDAVTARAQFNAALDYRFSLINAEVWKLPPGSDVSALTGQVATLETVAFAEPSMKIGGNAEDEPIPELEYAPGVLMVGYKEGVTLSEAATCRAAFGAALDYTYRLINAEVWRVDHDADIFALTGQVAALSAVEYAEPSWKVHIDDYSPLRLPNDPDYNMLYGMDKISAPTAWDTAVGDDNSILVASIDTGIDYDHEDLAASMWHNPGEIPNNGQDDDNNGLVDDYWGYDFHYGDSDPHDGHDHGSHTCGTIGGIGNNGKGVVGVVWTCRFIAMKGFSDGGSGYIDRLARCLEYAVLYGSKLSNNSWGGGGYNNTFNAMLDAAQASNCLFVAAAGNHGGNNDSSPYYPCCYPHDIVVGVAASDSSDNKAGFSAYGATTVDLAAPGVSTWSCNGSGGYRYFSGTSMATPHTCGAATLLWSVNPEMSPTEVKAILIDTCDQLSQWNNRVVSDGRLNVAAALAQVRPPESDPPVIVSVDPTPGSIVGRNLTMTMVVTDGVELASVTVNGTNAVETAPDTFQFSHSLQSWTNHFRILAKDKARNAATQDVFYVFIPDTNKPVIVSITPASGAATTQPTLPMFMNVTDDVLVAAVTVNGNNATKSGNDWVYNAPMAFGTNFFTVIARDPEGNSAVQSVFYVRIDVDAPVIHAIDPPDGFTSTNYSVPMSVVALDNQGVVALTINGTPAAYQGYDTWTYTVPTIVGSNEVTIIARDVDWNAATATIYYINNHTPIHYVSKTGSDTYPYNTWQRAARAIETVLGITDPSDRIIVAPGTYMGSISLNQAVTIEPEQTLSPVILSGGGATRCLSVSHPDALVHGVIISNGYAASNGGGLSMTAGTVSNCVIAECRSDNSGGGAWLINGGTLVDCTLIDNSALDGAGVQNDGGFVYNCRITHNAADNYGGGAKLTAGCLVNCLVADNSANFGGGAYMYYGGALTNCTIVDNTAINAGGVRYYYGGVTINSILRNNNGDNYKIAGTPLVEFSCTVPAIAGAGNITNDPKFVDAAGGDYHLAEFSKCMNVGQNADWMDSATDLDGTDRIIGPVDRVVVDMGCYESTSTLEERIKYVSPDGGHIWPFIRWSAAATNIQDAIDTADAGQTVIISNGYYRVSAPVTIAKTLEVRSLNGADTVVIDGSGATRCLYQPCMCADIVINGLTLSNGYAGPLAQGGPHGGGAYINFATFQDSVIVDCQADDCGGGLYLAGRTVATNVDIHACEAYDGGGAYARILGTLADMTIAGNAALNDGGGVYVESIATLDNVRISGSAAGNNGGGLFGNTNLLMSDSTIADSTATGNGGGAFLVEGCSLENCVITDGTAVLGGGVYSVASNIISGGIIADCTAQQGAGLYAVNGSPGSGLVITGNVAATFGGGVVLNDGVCLDGATVIGNTASAGHGGGVYCLNATVANCTVRANTAAGSYKGGGVYLAGGCISHSTISANNAYRGAGIEIEDGLVRNSVISNNVAGNYGGGVEMNFGGTVRNCLLEANQALFGGGAYLYYGGALTNCTVVDNTASVGAGIRASGGGSVHNSIVYLNNGANYANSGGSFTYTCTTPLAAGLGNSTDNPAFEDASNGDYRLAAESTCINAGLNDAWMAAAVDLDGVPRIMEATVDLGAYESTTLAAAITITNATLWVEYFVDSITVAGIANAHAAGSLWWENNLTGDSGTVPAAAAWQIPAMPLAEGDNIITVSGSNQFGEIAADSCTITRELTPADLPFVDITTPDGQLPYDSVSISIAGSANVYVVGGLAWQNAAGGQGSAAAGTSWVISGIPLVVGTNLITVTGTNSSGRVSSDTITLERLGPETGEPVVDIVTPNQSVPYTTTSVTIEGVNNESVFGIMNWEVYVDADVIDYGEFPATASWSFETDLGVGVNEIIVWGTNAIGYEAWDICYIMRNSRPLEEIDNFTITLSNDFATPILDWDSEAVTVKACTSDYYTVDAAQWFIRASGVTPPWADPEAAQSKSVFYRLETATSFSPYDVGKMTITVRQSDGGSREQNWLSSPFDFLDGDGNEIAALGFDALGVHAVVNDAVGPPSFRDVVYCQDGIGGATIYATRGDGLWYTTSAAGTNWHRDRMYTIAINSRHTGADPALTFVGRVPTNDPAHVATVVQSDGTANQQNWCGAFFPWVVGFDAAGIDAVCTDYSGVPAKRDAVYSQSAAGATIYATRGNGVWATALPASTNLYPGHGYNIVIKKDHTGPAREWYQSRTIPNSMRFDVDDNAPEDIAPPYGLRDKIQ